MKKNKNRICDGCGDCDLCSKCETCTACATCEYKEECVNDLLDELYTAIIPEGTTEIEHEEFSEVSGIHKVILPSSVRRIDDYAFEHCWNLEEVQMQEGVEYIGEEVFYRCAYLEKINLPRSLRVIGDRAFMGCYRLPELEIPEGVLALGEGTFDECGHLKKLTIPGAVRRMHEFVFGYGDKKLEIVYTGTREQWEALEWVGKEDWLPMVMFAAPVQAENDGEVVVPGVDGAEQRGIFPVIDGVLTIPEGEMEIARGAYMDDQEIKKVILPETLKQMGDLAFAGCKNLCEITIPVSADRIGYHVFKDCGNLREIAYAGSEEQFDALDWMEKRNYMREEPEEDWKEFSHWIKFIG